MSIVTILGESSLGWPLLKAYSMIMKALKSGSCTLFCINLVITTTLLRRQYLVNLAARAASPYRSPRPAELTLRSLLSWYARASSISSSKSPTPSQLLPCCARLLPDTVPVPFSSWPR